MTKIYKVLLTPYPQEFTIDADNEGEAIMKATERFQQSVWESEAEEVTD